MVLTLDFPPNIATQPRELSQAQQIPAEQLAFKFVVDGLNDSQSEQKIELTPDQELEQLIQEVKAMPPEPNFVVPAEESLLEALQNSQSDPDVNLNRLIL